MQSYRFFAFVAILVACALAVQGYPHQFEQLQQPQQPQQLQAAAIPEEAAGGVGQAPVSHNRQKKFAIISSYSAFPYSAYPYSTFSYPASYPSFYSYPSYFY